MRELQPSTEGLLLLVVKSRLLSLHQKELERIIFVKTWRYHGNGQEAREVTVCRCIPRGFTR